MSKEETICAIVVTYNRKELLLECLEALRKQTKPIDAVYIIDNASTDKTPELLKEKGYITQLPRGDLKEPWEKEFQINNLTNGKPIKVHYVRMHENTGGAGGFHEGVKRAYEKGYNWLWLMDDDAEPLKNTLQTLLENKNSYLVLAPLIIMKDGRVQFYHHKKINKLKCEDEPAIYFRLLKEAPKEKKIKIIEANAFVGPLINKKVVEVAGFPEKEMFIWDDDTEYTYRIFKKGFDIALVLNAFIYHKDKGYPFNTNPDKEQYRKFYYERKNKIYIARKYCGIFAVLYHVIKTTLSILKHRNLDLYILKMKEI